MNQFDVPRVFQTKPSTLKKKIALAAFIAGAASLTIAITDLVDRWDDAYFFACGITAMMMSFRFWNMQVRDPAKLTFKPDGIEIAERSSCETIPWAKLESIRYRIWRGGHYWAFKVRGREQTQDYYVDGLSSVQLDELRDTISTIQLPGLLVQTTALPGDIARVVSC